MIKLSLTLSWRRSLWYRNQSIDLLCKSLDWFLYDRDLRPERVEIIHEVPFLNLIIFYLKCIIHMKFLKYMYYSEFTDTQRNKLMCFVRPCDVSRMIYFSIRKCVVPGQSNPLYEKLALFLVVDNCFVEP